MPFKRISGPDGHVEPRTISSITVAEGDALMFDYENEVVILATSAMTPERFAGVADEAATTADTSVKVRLPSEDDRYIADTTSNSATTDNYHRLALTDEDEVANGADDTTDTGVFMQLGVVGATTDKKIMGYFLARQDRAA
jgi:hypothetical protein